MSKSTLTTSAATVTQRDSRGSKFMQNVGACYDKARLDKDRAQFLNEQPAFIGRLAALIEECSRPDVRFRFVTSFSIVVPQGYDHATRLAKFRNEHEKEFAFYNGDITDGHFAKATTMLAPGSKLKVKVVQITETVASEDCLAFLRNQKARLLGAQGVTFAYEQGKDKLPKGRYYASFDEKDALWEDPAGHHRVPGVYADSGGDFFFLLDYFESAWVGAGGLLCFCDEE